LQRVFAHQPADLLGVDHKPLVAQLGADPGVWPDEAPARRVAWLITHQDMQRAARIKAVSSVITEAFRRQRRILEQGIAAG
jgi:hypothetical protein